MLITWKKEEGRDNVRTQINKGYEIALMKPISNAKLEALEKLYQAALQKFKMDKDKTCEMVVVNDEHNNPETAALVVVTNAILNLDEVVTRN